MSMSAGVTTSPAVNAAPAMGHIMTHTEVNVTTLPALNGSCDHMHGLYQPSEEQVRGHVLQYSPPLLTVDRRPMDCLDTSSHRISSLLLRARMSLPFRCKRGRKHNALESPFGLTSESGKLTLTLCWQVWAAS